jgi:hypothetical protein
MSEQRGEREMPAEDSIKVVCRFRPLNDSEEKAGSKFVVKFPSGSEENCIAIGVRANESHCFHWLHFGFCYSALAAAFLGNV